MYRALFFLSLGKHLEACVLRESAREKERDLARLHIRLSAIEDRVLYRDKIKLQFISVTSPF